MRRIDTASMPFVVGDAHRDRGDLGAREARPPATGLDARPHVERVEPRAEAVEMLGVVRGLVRDLVGLLRRLLRDLLGHRVDDELTDRVAQLGSVPGACGDRGVPVARGPASTPTGISFAMRTVYC